MQHDTQTGIRMASPVGLALTWAAGLASAWGWVQGWLEAATLVLGVLIGLATLARNLRDLGLWPGRIRKPHTPEHRHDQPL